MVEVDRGGEGRGESVYYKLELCDNIIQSKCIKHRWFKQRNKSGKALNDLNNIPYSLSVHVRTCKVTEERGWCFIKI